VELTIQVVDYCHRPQQDRIEHVYEGELDELIVNREYTLKFLLPNKICGNHRSHQPSQSTIAINQSQSTIAIINHRNRRHHRSRQPS
jgi:hypothetical protein